MGWAGKWDRPEKWNMPDKWDRPEKWNMPGKWDRPGRGIYRILRYITSYQVKGINTNFNETESVRTTVVSWNGNRAA